MEERVKKLQQKLLEYDLDAILLSSVPNIFYVTGYPGFSIEERDAYVLVTKSDSYVISSALYAEAIKVQVPHMHSLERRRDNPFKEIMQTLFSKHKISLCGFEDNNLTVAEFNYLKSLECTFLPVDLENLRLFKDPDEIAKLSASCALADKTFTYILNFIKPGVTEKALASEIEMFMKKHGADRSFRSIVAFGENAAVPHHFSSDAVLNKHSCVLIDFGAKLHGYCSDMTRTIYVGKPPQEFKDIHQTALEAQEKAIELIETKLAKGEEIMMADIDIIARDYVVSKGYPPFNHASHGIGIEDHESPRFHLQFEDVLENNMVFSIEPGIYFPGKYGVRIEDDFIVRDNKLIQLTNAPKTLLEL